MIRPLFLAALFLTACRVEKPSLAPPAAPQDLLRSVVVEQSAPRAPAWINRPQRESAGGLEVVGSGEAATLDSAKELASRDLLAAVASVVSVDIESTFDDRSTNETQVVEERVRARTRAAMSGLKSDATYWERLGPSLISSGGAYRFHAHAFVGSGELAEARALKKAARREQIGRPAIALLPFTGDELAAGLEQDVAHHLSATGEALVSDPAAVRSLAAGLEGRSRVARALLPELMVAARISRDGARLRARLTYYRPPSDHPERTESIEVSAAELPNLSAQIARQISAALQIPGSSDNTARSKGPTSEIRPDAAATEAFHRAYAAFERGASDEALQQITHALELSPNEPRFHLRLGRILERIGHYARVPPIAARASAGVPDFDWCGSIGPRAEARAKERLQARATDAGPQHEEPWWSEDTPLVDEVLFSLFSAAPAAAEKHPPEKRSAIEAYARARVLARERADARTELEALLAAADLAGRVDRDDQAFYIYAQVYSQSAYHPDFQTRVLIGNAVLGKKRGLLPWAAQQLSQARAVALMLGDKPLLLEIDNELGAIEQALENETAAEDAYRRAERLAAELGNDYLRAAVGNNLGAFAAAKGRTAAAEARFLRAHRALSAIGEAEGTISAEINLGWASALRGDVEEATTHFAGAEHKVENTTQESRLAEVWSHRGMLAVARGDGEAGLEKLSAARRLLVALGRVAEAEKLSATIFAAEFFLEEHNSYYLDCVNRRYWHWDARVIASPWDHIPIPPRADRRIRGGPRVMREFPLAAEEPWQRHKRSLRGDPKISESPLLELELTLGAAAVFALSDWESGDSWQPYRVRTTKAHYSAPNIYAPVAPAVPIAPPHEQPQPPEPRTPEAIIQTVPGVLLEDVEIVGKADKRKATVQPPPEAPSRPAQFERILNTFVTSAGGMVLVDPELVKAELRPSRISWAREILDSLSEEFQKRDRARLAAAAELNSGALAWFGGDSEPAYRKLISARRKFAEAGDALGLIQAQKWIAFFLEESGADEIARGERAVAAALEQKFIRSP